MNKDFIYYASAAVLMAVTTQVASADRGGNSNAYGCRREPVSACDRSRNFWWWSSPAQETPSARPSSTVATASTATSEVANSSTPQVIQASSTTPESSESKGVTSESVAPTNAVASSENMTVSAASETSPNTR